MRRSDFLRGGATLAVLAPLTPLSPTVNATTALPLPFAVSTPAAYVAPGTAAYANALPAYLAVVGPGTGPLTDLQRQVQNGVRGAIDFANARRAPLDRTLDAHLFDDVGVVADARVAASSAVADAGAIATVGHLGGAATETALETYAQARMPLIVPIATGDAVTRRGFRNVFRLATRDALEGRIFAQRLLATRRPRRVAVVVPVDGYGPPVGEAFAATCRAAGVEATTLRVPAVQVEDELGALLRPLIETPPDAVFFAGTLEALERPARRLAEAGGPAIRLASQGFFTPDAATRLGAAAEGLTVSSSMPPLSRDAGSTLEIQAYRERYGDLTPIAAFAYAAAQVAITAIRRVNAVSRPALCDAIASGGLFVTLVGDFRFDAFGDPVEPNLYFYALRRGAWTASGSRRPTRFL